MEAKTHSQGRENASRKAGGNKNSPDSVLLARWAAEFGLKSTASCSPAAGLSPDLALKLNGLYHDGERFIEFCLAIAAARRFVGHGKWVSYVSTPCRFDFTLRTAQRRVEVGDVLLQLNTTTLSHLPRRAASVTKLARLSPALLRELAESRVIHRGLSISQVDAIVEKYLGAPEPKTANLLALIQKAEQITRETHGEWTPAKFQCVARVLTEFTELVETLCRQHESKSVSLARAEEPRTDQPSAAKFYEHEPNHRHSRSPAQHYCVVPR